LDVVELRINAIYHVLGVLAQKADLDPEQTTWAFMNSDAADTLDELRGQDWTLRVAAQIMEIVKAG